MNEKPKSKLRWRLLRWLLILAAVLVTLAALLVTEEDWRGKHAWENYKRDAAARGERLDIASVIPPTVPDDQNFFCAPIVAEALESLQQEQHGAKTTNRMNFDIYRGDSANWPNLGGNWQKGELSDLKPWQLYFKTFNESPEGKTNGFPSAAQTQTPAAAVLTALSCFDPALEELRQASQRPFARIPLDYDRGFDAAGRLLPLLANMKRVAQFLDLRILAELQNNQGEAALNDLRLYLRLTDSIREQPFLISHLVRIAMMHISLSPIYEGLSQHRWSDAQLAELEELLGREDFLADFEFAMRGEKVFAIDTFEKQRITRQMVQEIDDSHTMMTNSLRLMPAAYFYQNELNFARMHQEFIAPLIDLTNRIAAPSVLRKSQAEVQSQMKHYSLYKIQSQMVQPAIAACVTKMAAIQAMLDLARTACVLERYRLAHGEYPETLDTLAPQFIAQVPHDIINGQPLHYHRTDAGKFILYSIGWDEKDDGGKVFLTSKGGVDQKKGDWVWKY